MNPWWKRPSSESSSTASRSEAERRSRSKSRPATDDNGERRTPRRRRGRGGGGPSGHSEENDRQAPGSQGEQKEQRDRQGSVRSNRRTRSKEQPAGRSGSSRRGGRRRRGSRGNQRSRSPMVAVLVNVDDLHKQVKASGGKPEEAGALFEKVGEGAALRAVACGKRKQKVQRALRSRDFDIVQVEGGEQAARVCLALDAMELALAHRGAKIFMLAREGEDSVLNDRLRNQGAELTLFSVDQPPVVANQTQKPAAAEKTPNVRADEPANERSDEAPARDAGPRRRRAGRRGRAQGADAIEHTNEPGKAVSDSPEASTDRASSTVDPLALLTAAIAQLVEGESQLIWATKVRQEMSSLEPLFNETDHGYTNFDQLLREAERRGRVVLQKDPRTSTFIIIGWRAA